MALPCRLDRGAPEDVTIRISDDAKAACLRDGSGYTLVIDIPSSAIVHERYLQGVQAVARGKGKFGIVTVESRVLVMDAAQENDTSYEVNKHGKMTHARQTLRIRTYRAFLQLSDP